MQACANKKRLRLVSAAVSIPAPSSCIIIIFVVIIINHHRHRRRCCHHHCHVLCCAVPMWMLHTNYSFRSSSSGSMSINSITNNIKNTKTVALEPSLLPLRMWQ